MTTGAHHCGPYIWKPYPILDVTARSFVVVSSALISTIDLHDRPHHSSRPHPNQQQQQQRQQRQQQLECNANINFYFFKRKKMEREIERKKSARRNTSIHPTIRIQNDWFVQKKWYLMMMMMMVMIFKTWMDRRLASSWRRWSRSGIMRKRRR